MSSTITTVTGHAIDPWRAKPSDIFLEDIAHALAMTCRFGGHCRLFYSVAEHSLRVSHLAAHEPAWGLLHDAAEAYLADVPTPVKRRLPEFISVENNLLQVIATRFGLIWPMPASVHQADQEALQEEIALVLTPTVTPSTPFLNPEAAKATFLQQAAILGLQ